MSSQKLGHESRKYGLDVVPAVEAVLILNGCTFATLTPDEIKVLEFYRARGRTYGVALSIINKADPAELAKATSEVEADEIMRSANSIVSVVRI